MKSESIKNIGAALSVFHDKIGKIVKDADNPFFKSKYASLSNILEAIRTPLKEAGLVFTQLPLNDSELETILIHTQSGEFISASYSMRPAKDDPQGRGSAITYQRRYALSAILGLNIDDDDDGNAASSNNGAPAKIELPWLNENTKEYDGAVAKLKAGATTIDKIKKVMRLSTKVEQSLRNSLN